MMFLTSTRHAPCLSPGIRPHYTGSDSDNTGRRRSGGTAWIRKSNPRQSDHPTWRNDVDPGSTYGAAECTSSRPDDSCAAGTCRLPSAAGASLSSPSVRACTCESRHPECSTEEYMREHAYNLIQFNAWT